ncbi:MAG: PIG-L deacetylase family protein [Pannonibacter sp.]
MTPEPEPTSALFHVAVVMAHPDDAEIYLGGTILAWRQMGARVHIIIATDGAKGGQLPPADLARRRADEARAGADVLGASLTLAGHGDGGLSSNTVLVAHLRSILIDLAPDLVVTHAENDYHADHRALASATRAAASFSMPVALCDTMMGTGFVPTHYVDTSLHADGKSAAIRCHVSQDPERFVASAMLLSRFRSAQCGQPAGHAEAFRFEPAYPFADIRNLLPPAPGLKPVKARGPV